MTLPNLAKERDVRRLHQSVPGCGCDGACWEQCQHIAVTRTELVFMERALGRSLAFRPLDDVRVAVVNDARGYCPALDVEGRCSIYPARPLVCRLYGWAESLSCEHGCSPAGTAAAAAGLVDELFNTERKVQ